MAHFDVQNTGYTPDGADVTGCRRTQWREGTETGDDHVGTGAGAVVADGTVYHVGGEGGLHAVTAAAGDAEWTTELRGETVGTPTIEGGTLYLAAEEHLQTIDAGNGSERWHHEPRQRYRNPPSAWWYGTPKVVDGVVYAGSEGGQYGSSRATSWSQPRSRGTRGRRRGLLSRPLAAVGGGVRRSRSRTSSGTS